MLCPVCFSCCCPPCILCVGFVLDLVSSSVSAAINLKPDFAASYMYLATTLARLEDFDNACSAYEKVRLPLINLFSLLRPQARQSPATVYNNVVFISYATSDN